MAPNAARSFAAGHCAASLQDVRGQKEQLAALEAWRHGVKKKLGGVLQVFMGFSGFEWFSVVSSGFLEVLNG